MTATCVHQQKNKENVVYKHSEILFSHEKEGNPTFCNKMDKPEGHYTK